MFRHLAAAKLIHLVHQPVEEVTVVRHDDGCAVERAYRFLQYILRCQVEVVGRLVKDQQVHRLQQQAYHRQTTSFASREHLHLLLRRLATEHEGAQYIPYPGAYIAHRHIVDGLEHCQLLIQQLRLVLCEVTYLHVVTQLQLAAVLNLLHDALHQGGLTFSILAHEGDLRTSFDGECHILEDQVIAISFRQILHDHRVGA